MDCPMDCPAALKDIFPKYHSELDELLAESKSFQEIVADYRQILEELAAQSARDGGPNEAAVNDISAALSELENDVHEALVKHKAGRLAEPNHQKPDQRT